MKTWKLYQVSLFTALCVLLNYGGRLLASQLQLPFWLDSLGTVLCAYIGGPVCGATVGLTSNLIYGIENHMSAIYALTSIALGIVVGIAARKDTLRTMFGTLSVSAIAAIASVTISVPLNVLFSNGSTGNVWGEGVRAFLQEKNMPSLLTDIIGQFYVDFLDKLLTLFLLYLALLVIHRIGRRRGAKKAAQTLAVLLAVGLCGQAAGAQAQSVRPHSYNNYVQTVFSSANGLPCGEANDIAETNDGILWIGTYAGLYRYNGREFTRMDYDSVRNVNCLYVDEESRLWIGTNDNGLSIAINEAIANVLDQSNGLPTNSVRSILQSSDGYYYIGTTGSMQILTINGGLKRVSTLWEVNHAEHIAADRRGHIAAVTADGRLFLIRQGKIQSSMRLVAGEEAFKSCCFTPQGYLLAGSTTNRIFMYDVSSGSFDLKRTITCSGLTSINDLYYMDNGELFITADNGVSFLDTDGAYHRLNTNSFNSSIDNMQADYQDNLWFASSRLGLLRMAPSSFQDIYSSAGMESRVVNSVVRWQGQYYFGTDKGLDVVNASCDESVTNALTEQLEGVRIRCMTVDDADSLWICTYSNGLMEVLPDGTQYHYNALNSEFGSKARVVTQLSDGTVLAGSNAGLIYVRDHKIERTVTYSDGLSNQIILTLTEMADGRIIAGTDGGGIAVIRDGKVERMLTRADGLSSEVILRTVADPGSDGLFIVTSNGLCYMEPDGSVRALENFPYFNNYYVWPRDKDTLFVMSSAGIYVMQRDDVLADRKNMAYDLLDSRRGLSSSLTANSWCYADPDGRLFLPCDTGVFAIDADHYAAAANTYRMSIKGVRMDNDYTSLRYSSAITIPRSVGRIELYPEFINFTIQDPYVGFWMEGFDNDWTVLHQSSLNSIVYTNLPSGKYTLHLAVLDSNQEDLLSERTYSVVKKDEIYDHRGFMVYLLVVPMVTVAWITWYFMRRRMHRMMERQAHEMERREHELALARQQIQMGNETIIAIAKAVDAKDERTSQHSLRVSQYSVMIAQELGFSEKECENLRKAALMHDIGKIGIPDAILNKPARLTDEEYAVMKSHTTHGAEILKDFTLIDHVVEGAAHHHERWDGRGYPSGLKGEEIPIYARIIGVADAFDAMTANRVYRKQMDFDYVLGEMRKGRGTQFDAQIVDILLRLIDEGKIDLHKLYAPKNEEGEKA